MLMLRVIAKLQNSLCVGGSVTRHVSRAGFLFCASAGHVLTRRVVGTVGCRWCRHWLAASSAISDHGLGERLIERQLASY